MLDKNNLEKLNYIGLDLKNIQEFSKDTEKLKYRPQEAQDEKNYKIYKYIEVGDIDILITPTDRLENISNKYKKAIPLSKYLNPKNKELHEIFLTLLNNLDLDSVKKLEDEQNKLNGQIPLNVKSESDYLWQIYYSDEENKYFMLTPIAETETAQMFYVLKKQIENSKNKIFVPICQGEYKNKLLDRLEISKMENAILLFTGNWPSIYEVYDITGNIKLVLTGKTKILDNIQSSYRMEFTTKEETTNFYTLTQALFLLQIQYPNFYRFKTKVLETGNLQIIMNNKIITLNNISDFIKESAINNIEKTLNLKQEKEELINRLANLKTFSLAKQHEYIEKEKEISTYLECKKTFIGRVKYFLKFKKTKNKEEDSNKIEKQTSIKYFEKPDIKSIYTMQDLIEITKELQKETNSVNILKLDIEALESKIELLNKKIENAKLYIKEIDNHKKSIFEFWKFTSKNEPNSLVEGQAIKNEKKINKYFNIEKDLEEIKTKLDEIVRDNLTREELDSVFIATTDILEDINKIYYNEMLGEDTLNDLKHELEEYKANFTLYLGESKTMHRETKRNKLTILHIDNSTTIDTYKKQLDEILDNINNAIQKIKINIEIPLYFITKKTLTNGLQPFVINPYEIIKNKKDGSINIYKVITNNNIGVIPLTNIIYFNNINKTLPVGMDSGTKVLVDTNSLDFKKIVKEDNNILTFVDNKIHVLKVNIYSYSE